MVNRLMIVKKPQRKVSTPKFLDEKFTGPEPKWDSASKWTDDKKRQEITHAFYFYNYYMTAGDMRKYVVEFGQKYYKWGKAEISAFAECDDNRVGITIGSASKMILNGAPLAHDAEYIVNKLDELLAYGREKIATKKVVKDVPKRTVKDHVAEKYSDTVGDIEAFYDEMIDGASALPDFMVYFREKNMPQAFCSRIREKYAAQYGELLESQNKKGDADLREAYAWMTKADFKRYDTWYKSLFDALTTYGNVKSAVRKVRKPRPVSKEKLVKKVKFLQKFDELNLVSISPVDVLNATELWVYNIKTRKIGKYVADSSSGVLGIKGSTIIGYDEKLSVAKTLRKPKEQIKEFQAAGKVALRKFLDNIRAVEIALTGRLNGDTILLKSVK
jgi:hypothetical protein